LCVQKPNISPNFYLRKPKIFPPLEMQGIEFRCEFQYCSFNTGRGETIVENKKSSSRHRVPIIKKFTENSTKRMSIPRIVFC